LSYQGSRLGTLLWAPRRKWLFNKADCDCQLILGANLSLWRRRQARWAKRSAPRLSPTFAQKRLATVRRQSFEKLLTPMEPIIGSSSRHEPHPTWGLNSAFCYHICTHGRLVYERRGICIAMMSVTICYQTFLLGRPLWCERARCVLAADRGATGRLGMSGYHDRAPAHHQASLNQEAVCDRCDCPLANGFSPF